MNNDYAASLASTELTQALVKPTAYEYLVHRKRAEFAHLAPQYELQCLLATCGRIASMRRRVAQMALSGVEGPVVELCCGTGGVTEELGSLFERVIGIDLSPDMLARARQRIARAGLQDRVTLREGEASTVGFGDGSLAAVVISLGLHELPAWIRDLVIARAARWLKPGGRFVFCDYVLPRNRLVAMVFRWLGRLLIEEEHFDEYLAYPMEQRLQEHGFKLVARQRRCLSCVELSAWSVTEER